MPTIQAIRKIKNDKETKSVTDNVGPAHHPSIANIADVSESIRKDSNVSISQRSSWDFAQLHP